MKVTRADILKRQYIYIMEENPISCERSIRLLNYFDTPIYNNSCLLHHQTSGQYVGYVVRVLYGIYKKNALGVVEIRMKTVDATECVSFVILARVKE